VATGTGSGSDQDGRAGPASVEVVSDSPLVSDVPVLTAVHNDVGPLDTESEMFARPYAEVDDADRETWRI
jgi:hypothetical protein